MEQILFGIILVLVGVASLLEAIGLVEIVSWWQFASPVIVLLVGVFMILRVQGRLAIRKVERKQAREEARRTQEKKQKEAQDRAKETEPVKNTSDTSV